jgi:hypothetical protein
VPESQKVASGVGSAKGVRWRGEIEPVEDRPGQPQGDGQGDGSETPGEGDSTAEGHHDVLTRAAPPWLISTILHLVLLLILALITTPAGKGLTNVMLTVGESSRETPAELTEFAIDSAEAPEEQAEAVEDAPVELDMSKIFETAEIEPIEEVQVDVGAGPQIASAKPMFGGRSGSMKQALMAMYGGTPETENAVARGLAWLKRNQEKRTGGWSMRGPYSDPSFSENRVAATAMAVLAFLGDGNTHLSGQYAGEVKRGIDFLLKTQDRSGFFAEAGRQNDSVAYAQAQATIAICEAYGMTRDSQLRAPAQAAIDYAQKAQSDEGGWRYRPRFDSDTSVTGWYVMALKSGLAADLDVNSSVLDNVSHYLETVQSYEGAAYAYRPGRPPSPAMTAEGLLCRQYLGWPREHVAMIRGSETLAYDYAFELDGSRERDVYYWYYATQVLHHYGGAPWRAWNERMRELLPEIQIKRGSEEGSWPPQTDKWGSQFGRLYTTCLSIYCLEVYYRHMPLYSVVKEEEEKRTRRVEGGGSESGEGSGGAETADGGSD